MRPLILAGGMGARLAPLSTPEKPKQFHKFGRETLFQGALRRAKMVSNARPIVVCNKAHEAIVWDQATCPIDVIVEVKPQNTAAAVAAGIELGGDGEYLAMPADQMIHGAFAEAVSLSLNYVADGYITVFGTPPKSASKSYGYIKPASDKWKGEVEDFREKPDNPEELIGWLWNTGIYAFRSDAFMDEWTRQGKQLRSIDHAVMEGARKRAVVRAGFEWSDMGTWDTVLEWMQRETVRPWGSYSVLDEAEGYKVKRIEIQPGQAISLQKHFHRAEHWTVVRGRCEVRLGEATFFMEANESAYVPVGMMHRLRNVGSEPCEIIEVQTGSYLGEDDIQRFQDEYGRA